MHDHFFIMNKQLIEKLLTANQQPCPQFAYSNPALDENVARAISKCFVQLIGKTRENCNGNMLRDTILDTIRNMCKSQPSEHVDIDEHITELLIDVHQKQIRHSELDLDSVDKHLDAFLIRTSKEIIIKPHLEMPTDPEVVKALINLNDNKDFLNGLSKSVIHWNTEDSKTQNILNELWERNKSESGICEDLSIKVRSDIEKLLIENALTAIDDENGEINYDFTSNNDLTALIKSCSNSSNCFQICISILNSLLILAHFNPRLLEFINTFVYSVKNKCERLSFSVLYPPNLTHITTLLDLDVDEIKHETVKCNYINTTLKYLKAVNEESENSLIMLLSHFPQWFDIYFEL